MDGNGRRQVQSQLPGRESRHVCLYPMGEHDGMSGGRTPALGQQSGRERHPADYPGKEELPLLRQPWGGGKYVGHLFFVGCLQGTRCKPKGVPE